MPAKRTGIDFRALLPQYNEWLRGIKESYAAQARALEGPDFAFVNSLYPQPIIAEARLVVAPSFPRPPFEAMGVPELAYWSGEELAGVTYGGVIFVKQIDQPLVFHELVHVAQKHFIGYDAFHAAYAQFILNNGYDNNPFEATAYTLEDRFETRTLPDNFVDIIRNEAEAAMTAIA